MTEIPLIPPEQLDRLVEALLFVADGPVQPSELARALSVQVEPVIESLDRLAQALQGRGLVLARERGRVQLASIPEAAPYVETFLGLTPSSHLTRAALEAAAIIAYRQPVTRAQVSDIRGVDSDGVIRTLQARGLVEEVGRLEQVGRPILYGTTFEFLQYFGIQGLDGLPELPEAEGEEPAVAAEEESEGAGEE